MQKIKFSDCVEYMIKGPFGSDMKKSLYVPKGDNTYKVYIQINAIQKNQTLGDYYVSEDYFHKKLERFEVHPGDYLITCDGTLGKFIKLDENIEKGVISSSLLLLKLKEDVIYDKYFELIWEYSMLGYLASQARNACLVHLPSAKAIGDVEVLLPDLAEQIELAEHAFSISNIVEKRKEELTLFDTLIKARFVEMFGEPETNPNGYPVRSMADIASYWNGLTYKPEDVSEEGTIVLRSSNIQSMQLDFADTVRVSCKIGDKKYVQENDILMCSRNGSAKLVGKVALIQGIKEPMSFGAFMMIIRSDYYPYLMTYFQMPAFRSQIVTGATTTINQITGSMMDKVFVPVPDKRTMDDFAAFVAQVDKSKAAVQAALDKAQLLFDSLMQQYFG